MSVLLATSRPGPRCRYLLMIAVVAIAFVGCNRGPAMGNVSGKVTFQGQPVTEGTVAFNSPDKGTGATAPIGPDGSFKLENALVPGNYKVTILPPPAPPPPATGGTPPPAFANIPQTYRASHTTPFTANVELSEAAPLVLDMQAN